MLPKQYKLAKRDIEFVLRKGRQHGNTFIALKFVENRQEHNRYSVIISKKTLKEAHDRNKVRRQVYEILRALPKAMNESGQDISILIKRAFVNKEYNEKQDIVTACLQNLISARKA